MTTYATFQDLMTLCGERELVDASDREGTGEVNEARVMAALVQADNEINAAIGARYALPLTDVPPLLADLARDIARYKLYPLEAPPLVRQRYEDATAKLGKLASGTLTLPIATAAPAQPAAADVAFTSSERLFTRERMGGL